MKRTATKNFENKLKAYSAIAVGATAMAAAGTAQGQIVYTDVNPDEVILADSIPGTYNLDMDADAVIDFEFSLRTYGTGLANVQANFNPIDPATAQALGELGSYTSFGYALALALNDPISIASTGWVAGIGQWILASVYGGTTYGNCGDNADHYLGVYFDISGTKHYGWIRVGGIPTDGSTVTVKDYAYNTVADQAIYAGQTINAGISNNASLTGVNVFSSDRNVIVNASEIGGTINIFNNLGQLVKSANIDDTHSVIDMVSAQAGIYLVQIQQGDQAITKRVILK